MYPSFSYKFPVLIFLFLVTSLSLRAQSTDSSRHQLTISLEVRPRVEFRKDFSWTATDSINPARFASQRTRLAITYQNPFVKIHASPQEIHVWNNLSGKSTVGSINFFELYIEPRLTKEIALRIGRQALTLDNGRLLSAAPWAQQGRSHEGMRLFFTHGQLATDLTAAFTRPYDDHFNEQYSPVASHRYHWLFIHHFKFALRKHLTLTGINASDLFKTGNNRREQYARYTSGGRLDLRRNKLTATFSAYFQYGKTAELRPIRAYYFQPELSSNLRQKTMIRLGAELLSGSSASAQESSFRSFIPLYGVAWKFMGNMNLFAKFPGDVNSSGLINPYLFVIHQLTKTLSVRTDYHLFYSEHPLKQDNTLNAKRYLGFENDLSLNYKPLDTIELNVGFSYLLPGKSMELLQKIKSSDTIPVWSYLMIAYTPTLCHYRSRH